MSELAERPAPDVVAALHPVVAAAFRCLDDAGVRWALLRGADDLARPSGDVDLLVDPAARDRLDGLLATAGLCRLGARGHGSHRFYFRYDSKQRFWVKLDVVTEIAFGTFQHLAAPLAAGCLDRRHRSADVWRLAADDEDWLFLLHLLLDKGRIAPDRREAALGAAARVGAAGPVPELLDRLLGAGSAAGMLDAIRRADPAEIAEAAAVARRRWARRQPIAATWSWLLNRALRRLDLPASDGPAGATVALVGPDGAGKTTLSQALRADFPASSRSVHMGIWREGRYDAILGRLPGGRLGQRTARVVRSAAAVRYHRLRGRLVVLDRSVHDARLLGAEDPSFGGRAVAAVAGALVPEPDLVVVLDAPGEVMFARKGEHSVEVLEARRQSYLALVCSLPDAIVVDATLPAEEVAHRAMSEIGRRLSAPARPRGGRGR